MTAPTTTEPVTTEAKSWPFQEARSLIRHLDARPPEKGPEKGFVLFETGYGPSGLPHIGTFGEVVRTNMVRQAFGHLTDLPTRLYVFSDDMDGLRQVPDNIPNPDMVHRHLGQPLTRIPDPFGLHESFGHHNNAKLRAFLDSFDFSYTFQSATQLYQAGHFDPWLIKILHQYDTIRNIVLPTLGPERRQTYAPFLPICPDSGQVLQAKIVETKPEDGTVIYEHPTTGHRVETPVTGGHCKLQWKVDWAMRWAALGVDYEMSGKDLIESVRLSNRIVTLLGARPPRGLTYELFLDQNGEKISKSRGNGLSVEEWLAYAPRESLSLFMYNAPQKAKRLYFDIIPRTVDGYLTCLATARGQKEPERLDNPAWHIHGGSIPERPEGLTYSLLLNLASVCHAETKKTVWGFIKKYAPDSNPKNDPLLDRMVAHAVAYYRDFIRPQKSYRRPDNREKQALQDLCQSLKTLAKNADSETIQNAVYAVGKRHDFANLREWFQALYEILLGQSQGPRMGSFIALYGIEQTQALIESALAGGLVQDNKNTPTDKPGGGGGELP